MPFISNAALILSHFVPLDCTLALLGTTASGKEVVAQVQERIRYQDRHLHRQAVRVSDTITVVVPDRGGYFAPR